MNLINEPLIFEPLYKSYIWGGDKIAKLYGRGNTPDICAESWEISAHQHGMSIVASGTHKGLSLKQLTEQFGATLLGTRTQNPAEFPLLFKIIDAKRTLSVQVHPDNQSADLTNGEPKTEMWYVLDCEPNAALYAGLRSNTTESELKAALQQGAVAELLVQLEIKSNQALFIPGGLVHAIGSGSLIYEVQQSSNTTYRLFDWNRIDENGNPRDLHIKESLQTINWNLPPAVMTTPSLEHEIETVISCDLFTMKRWFFDKRTELTHDNHSFTALFAVNGDAVIHCGGVSVQLNHGSSALIPASVNKLIIEPDHTVTLLATTV